MASCEDCYREEDRAWDECTRKDQLCTRKGQGPVLWAIRSTLPRMWMGAPGRDRPREDIDLTGCPAGYRYSRFVESVMRYVRTEKRSNPLYDRCTDDLIHEAVTYLERCQDGLEHYTTEVVYA